MIVIGGRLAQYTISNSDFLDEANVTMSARLADICGGQCCFCGALALVCPCPVDLLCCLALLPGLLYVLPLCRGRNSVHVRACLLVNDDRPRRVDLDRLRLQLRQRLDG